MCALSQCTYVLHSNIVQYSNVFDGVPICISSPSFDPLILSDLDFFRERGSGGADWCGSTCGVVGTVSFGRGRGSGSVCALTSGATGELDGMRCTQDPVSAWTSAVPTRCLARVLSRGPRNSDGDWEGGRGKRWGACPSLGRASVISICVML